MNLNNPKAIICPDCSRDGLLVFHTSHQTTVAISFDESSTAAFVGDQIIRFWPGGTTGTQAMNSLGFQVEGVN